MGDQEMSDSLEDHTADAAAGLEQPLLRRRDRRRNDGNDAPRTGTMPTVRSTSSSTATLEAEVPSPPQREPLTAADVMDPVVDPGTEQGPAERPYTDEQNHPQADPDPEAGLEPQAWSREPVRGSARDAAREALADAPMPDFISSPGLFVREQKPRPVGGFRGVLYALSGGAWNLGPSARQRNEDELGRRISRQLQGSYNTAVLSLKGGIGKTSTTVGVGLTLAEFRGDPPCAIDANPDSGDLVERALGEGIYQQASPRTISDLLKNIDSIESLTALARYMHHAGRLHLIAGEQDPEVSDSLTAEEYLRIRKLISNYYSVALTDCGTGVTHNAMSGILQSADNLIIAAGYAVSGAKRARSTLQWLAHHGYEDLARNAIVVITDKDEVSTRVDKDAIEEHLSGICRQLIAVPHDRGVADGDLVTLESLRPETRRAYREIAAAIVDGYR
jgi:MinD-like ATPase involved in chromosome partitioning or flagellar assembly